MAVYYHATPEENMSEILANGIKTGCDGVVYLADNCTGAAKFVAVRGVKRIIVFEVNVPDEKVEESFDHNFMFFKERAFSTSNSISTERINFENVRLFEV